MALFEIHAVDEQIKALPTVDTASGSVATFDTDLTEDLIEVVCDIQYSQASGTPTPSSPLPILVFDHLDLFHNSINQWNEQWEVGAYDLTTGKKTTSNTQIRSKTMIKVLPSTDYKFVSSFPSTSVLGILLKYNEYGFYLGYEAVYGDAFNISIPSDTYFITFYCTSGYGTTYNNDISINYPSTDTQYHAFNGAYITFGQTVANGVLDVTTGKLRITHEIVDMGSLTWTKSGNNHFADLPKTIKQTSSAGETANIACEIFATAPQTSYSQNNNQITYYYTGSTEALSKIIVYSTDYADLTSFETAITGYKMMWELATPIEIQLDSTQITTLLNQNHIWCDTGDTEVKYLLTVGKKIA